MFAMKKTIVFDWNGTLLDDVEICWRLLNELLTIRRHPTVTLETYRQIFTFPIQTYYERAGFSFPEDDFVALAKRFDRDYRAAFPRLSLFPDAKDTLDALKSSMDLIVLSASKQANLEDQLKQKGIAQEFSAILGIQDIYGASKLERGRAYFATHPTKTDALFFIGDTLHDAEVAHALGGQAILIAQGHQAKNILEQDSQAILLPSLKELPSYLASK